MKITVLGTTLQAGVLAGLFSENGHQVTWCPNTSSELLIHYQDDVVNQLIKKQIQTGFLTLKHLDQVNSDQDVFLFSYAATEVNQAILAAHKITQLAVAHPKLMINSSTFGLYGTEKLKQILTIDAWAYLPDVIQEGNAVNSFTLAKQIIVGVDSDLAANLVQELLRPIFQFKYQYLFMPILDAEFTKLSISGMLATRISYMNDLALVTEKLGIDILNVQQGLAADSRIGSAYLSAGVGFGGENFSHDILTLSNTVSGTGVNSQLLEQVWEINEQQKEILFRKLWNHYNADLKGKVVAIWGASFKENTSSINNAPIHVMLDALWAQGVIVHLHDPQALDEIRKRYGQRNDLVLCEDQYQTVQSADALCLMTAWKQYLSPDFKQLKALMKHAFILDGRNVYNPEYVKAQGFIYAGVGRA
ncbi:nucleotide sugar dehydrogenase [Acinetobacter sp. ANC 4648]|uniref:nucleotide sugar dehydrogenase n=1 Tax=Acinetobacter sp. ANC 4648 TaxID=1977875 RepID=UPI000A34C293|nr:nucleotide sugar dehydrogenase [Acinetobacter sp. ANC 4648]OTG85170.1 UDP-glucose 6-dehydrogenase [Acinetobacter sp. ANC 4648]